MLTWSNAEGPLLFAHRGASAELPENTLPSFRRALELGADVLELDVHATLDEVIVVFHDDTGERTCGVPKRINETAWAELGTWDAGWGFVDALGARPFAAQGIRPARFDEVLVEFPNALLNVDIKEATDREIQRLIALIEGHGATDRVLLTSFSRARIQAVRRAGYRGPLGLSRPDALRLYFVPALLNALCPFHAARAQLPPRSSIFDLSTRAVIDKAHRAGLRIDYWVINDAEHATALLERGADGIITDDPRAIAEAFRRSAITAGWRKRRG